MVAAQIGMVVYAAVFLLVIRQRMFYAAFCVILILAAGAASLEYAPALWLPVDFAFMLYRLFFRKTS